MTVVHVKAQAYYPTSSLIIQSKGSSWSSWWGLLLCRDPEPSLVLDWSPGHQEVLRRPCNGIKVRGHHRR
ncbi:hypothetical protein TNCV_1764171 [Trichonephila clavipes]|nr:hypothetical protein TNCV_1764171 [Trichonephila clavipes]